MPSKQVILHERAFFKETWASVLLLAFDNTYQYPVILFPRSVWMEDMKCVHVHNFFLSHSYHCQMLLTYCKMLFQLIKKKGFTFDVAFTSVLKRAIKTLYLIQEGTDLHWIPVYRSWRLNERHYGGLQGLNKAETAAKHGEEQVKVSSILWLSNWAVNEL